MWVRLLGAVDVSVDGTVRPVRGLRRRAVLATLALRPGEVVSTDQLVDVVWGRAAPATALNTLQSHVSHLRRVMGSKAAILGRPPGYAIGPDAEPTDVQAAEELIRRGMQSADHAQCARDLHAALALWRGPSLADVAGVPWLEEQAARLDHLRQQARQAWLETRLNLGEHAQVVPDLEQLARDRPFDEPVHHLLMLALYRCGRQTDALDAYQRLQRSLDAELGIRPGQPLRDLEVAILRQDPALHQPEPAAVRTATPAPPVPMQLPPPTQAFAGRGTELANLDALLPRAAEPGPTAVVITAVSGTAGIGKTTLAVHWAHGVAGQFPDGQLYVNLRGFDPAGTLVDPADAVRGFLHALGVPADRIPAGLDERTALYRSVLAGRRVLVVLDNARDADHVRPLLPSTAGCLALVTSRNRLAPLVAAEGAHPITLDLLPTPEATELLTRRIGADRTAAEPQATAEIVVRCARLPLALTIVAARAAIHRTFSLTSLAAELAETSGRLTTLAAGDPSTDLRAVFSWSYQALTAPAARLFRLLGLQPGPDISAPAAASLAGISPAQVRPLQAELARASLLTEYVSNRYTCHDLLRAYATEQTWHLDTDAERDAAIHRMLDHYVHTAHSAALLLHPTRPSIPAPLAPPAPGANPEHLDGHGQAMAWLTAEVPTLLAVLRVAADSGLDNHCWQLAWALDDFLRRQGRWHDLATAWQTAVQAADRLGDPAVRASAHRNLAYAHGRLGRYPEAHAHFRTALDLHDGSDPRELADAHQNLALLWGQQGRFDRALDHAEQALALYLRAGARSGQAYALNSAGWYHANLGDHRRALVHCEQALALFQRAGDRSGQAATWDSLGYAHHHLGHHALAVTCYQRAIDLYRDVGDRYNEADTLNSLGEVHHTAGLRAAARTAWQQALDILTDLDHPDAAEVRARLRRGDRTTANSQPRADARAARP